MRICWYWPYFRDEYVPLAEAMAALPDVDLDIVTVAGRRPEVPGVRVRDVLPDVPARSEGSLRWLASRATVYPHRARVRDREVAKGAYDVVHVVFANYFTDGLSAPRLARRGALVTSVHDAVPHESRVPAPIERTLLGLLYRRGGTLVVHHESVAEALERDFAVAPARIHRVPLWVLPVVSEPRDAPSAARRVLAFGAFRRNKGLDVLVAAARTLGATARVTIAGRGAADVEALVRAAGAAGTIDAEVGYVETDRKDELYRAADVVVLPYTSFASQSAVLHDAYAHGRPVVVTDVGALGPSVRADGTGRVVPAGDAEALAAAVAGLLEKSDEWASAASAARDIAARRGPAAHARALRAVYEAAIRG